MAGSSSGGSSSPASVNPYMSQYAQRPQPGMAALGLMGGRLGGALLGRNPFGQPTGGTWQPHDTTPREPPKPQYMTQRQFQLGMPGGPETGYVTNQIQRPMLNPNRYMDNDAYYQLQALQAQVAQMDAARQNDLRARQNDLWWDSGQGGM